MHAWSSIRGHGCPIGHRRTSHGTASRRPVCRGWSSNAALGSGRLAAGGRVGTHGAGPLSQDPVPRVPAGAGIAAGDRFAESTDVSAGHRTSGNEFRRRRDQRRRPGRPVILGAASTERTTLPGSSRPLTDPAARLRCRGSEEAGRAGASRSQQRVQPEDGVRAQHGRGTVHLGLARHHLRRVPAPVTSCSGRVPAARLPGGTVLRPAAMTGCRP